MAGMVKPYSGLPPGRHTCSIWQRGVIVIAGRMVEHFHHGTCPAPHFLQCLKPLHRLVWNHLALLHLKEEETTALPVGTSNHRESMDFNERTFHGQTEPVQS